MIALADCNNFFVSCERVFQPELEGKSVVVLSNNDGCVVARSNESKLMGIKMGTPFFQVKHLVEQGRLIVKSSNYTLYGDLSDRVMSILSDSVPALEVYSIDEAFMIYDGLSSEKITELSRDLMKRVRQWTGIPISIGIADTKTLAKIASHFAKKYPGYKGVCAIDNEHKREKALEYTPIGDVWGIGRRIAPKLIKAGINTALDFTKMPAVWVRKYMGVNGLRTWNELKGTPATFESQHEIRQTITTSRSFAETTNDLNVLIGRVSDYAAMCASKLRKEQSSAQTITVMLQTNRFRLDLPQYARSASIKFEVPESNTPRIVQQAIRVLKMIYKPGYEYKKAGVTLSDTIKSNIVQGNLFDTNEEKRKKADKITEIMDKVNVDGKILRLATQDSLSFTQGVRKEHCSQSFSTDFNDLLTIKVD